MSLAGTNSIYFVLSHHRGNRDSKHKIIPLADNVAKGTFIIRLTERHPTVHTPTKINKQVNTQVYNRKGPHTIHTPTKVNKRLNTQHTGI